MKRANTVHQDTVLYAPSSFVQFTTATDPKHRLTPNVGDASALTLQPKNDMRESGGVFDPHCMLDFISCIPSPSYSSTVDSSPSSISSTRSTARQLMPMMPCVSDNSTWDMDQSPTYPWDAASPSSTQRSLSDFSGFESLASTMDLPDTVFESYLHSPPPELAIQLVSIPESLSSHQVTHLAPVPEGDSPRTSNSHQERHPSRDTYKSVESDHKAALEAALAQSVQLGDRTLPKIGQLGQDSDTSAVHKWCSLDTGYWPQLQPSTDMLPPVYYPSSICSNDQQLRCLTRHEPWMEGVETVHPHFSSDAVRGQEQEAVREPRLETLHGLFQYPFLHHSQEGGVDPYEDTDLYHPGQFHTDVKCYDQGGPAFGYLTPSPSTLKRRRRLSAEETSFLISQFRLNEKPTAQERQLFAKHLNLDRRTIQVWFQNRRAKLKREESSAASIEK